MSVILGDKYEIIECIGEGTFGRVFKGKNTKTKDIVAIKIQHKSDINIIKYEAKIYKHLRDIAGIPNLRNYGKDQGYTYLCIDFIDISLCEKNFTPKNFIYLFTEAIKIIERVHALGVLHRDIKPDNFMYKTSTKTLYLIDFGLSKIYIDKHQKHMEERKDRKLIGTAKYSSLNVHNGIEPSRRDDIESLCYTFIKLYSNNLLWDGITEYDKIKKLKQKSLRWLYDIPGEFITLLLYARKLSYMESPNYQYIFNLINNLLMLM